MMEIILMEAPLQMEETVQAVEMVVKEEKEAPVEIAVTEEMEAPLQMVEKVQVVEMEVLAMKWMMIGLTF